MFQSLLVAQKLAHFATGGREVAKPLEMALEQVGFMVHPSRVEGADLAVRYRASTDDKRQLEQVVSAHAPKAVLVATSPFTEPLKGYRDAVT